MAIYDKAKTNVQQMSDEEIKQRAKALAQAQEDGQTLSDTERDDEEEAEALRAFQDVYNERFPKESESSNQDTNKQAQRDTKEDRQTNTPQQTQTDEITSQQPESRQEIQEGPEKTALDESVMSGELKQDEDVLNAQERQQMLDMLSSGRDNIMNMTEEEFQSQLEILQQEGTGEAQQAADVLSSYRDRENRFEELATNNVNSLYDQYSNDELTQKDLSMLKDREPDKYNQLQELIETKDVLNNADKNLNDDTDVYDDVLEDGEINILEMASANMEMSNKLYNQLQQYNTEMQEKLNSEEIIGLKDELSSKNTELENINKELKKVKENVANKFPGADSATIEAITADRQSDLLDRKNTLLNESDHINNKIQTREQAIKSEYQTKTQNTQLRLQQQQENYQNMFGLMKFQIGQEQAAQDRAFRERQFDFTQEQFQFEQEQEARAMEEYRQKLTIQKEIESKFAKNIDNTRVIQTSDGFALLDKNTGELKQSRGNEDLFGSGTTAGGEGAMLRDRFDGGMLNISYNEETGEVEQDKSYVQQYNVSPDGTEQPTQFYSTAPGAFVKGMDIDRRGTIAEDTNNPGNITADSVNNPEEYGKNIGAIGTYKSKNGREYFVFPDVKSGFQTLIADVKAKQQGGKATQTNLNSNSTLKELIETHTGSPVNHKLSSTKVTLQTIFGDDNLSLLWKQIGSLDPTKVAQGLARGEGFAQWDYLNKVEQDSIDTMKNTNVPDTYYELDDVKKDIVKQKVNGTMYKAPLNKSQGLAEVSTVIGNIGENLQKDIIEKTGDENLAYIHTSFINDTPPSRDLQNIVSSSEKMLSSLNSTETALNKFRQEQGEEGFGSFSKKIIDSKKAWETGAQLLGFSETLAAQFGRTIENRLTDEDLKRYKKVVPNATNTQEANQYLGAVLRHGAYKSIMLEFEAQSRENNLTRYTSDYKRYKKLFEKADDELSILEYQLTQ